MVIVLAVVIICGIFAVLAFATIFAEPRAPEDQPEDKPKARALAGQVATIINSINAERL